MNTLTIIVATLVGLLIVAVSLLGAVLFKVREQVNHISNKNMMDSLIWLYLLSAMGTSKPNDMDFLNKLMEDMKKKEETPCKGM